MYPNPRSIKCPLTFLCSHLVQVHICRVSYSIKLLPSVHKSQPCKYIFINISELETCLVTWEPSANGNV